MEEEREPLYAQAKGPVPAIPYAILVGKADIKRRGEDVTVVATIGAGSPGVASRRATGARGHRRRGHRSARCAGSTLRRSSTAYRKTSRLAIVHEGYRQCLEVRSGNPSF